MANSRRQVLEDGVATAAALSLLGVSRSAAPRRSPAPGPVATERADAFMVLFALRCRIVRAPAGGADLAAAISSAGVRGHMPLWGRTQETAGDNVRALGSRTKQPFAVNDVPSFEPRSRPAALDAGAPLYSSRGTFPAPSWSRQSARQARNSACRWTRRRSARFDRIPTEAFHIGRAAARNVQSVEVFYGQRVS